MLRELLVMNPHRASAHQVNRNPRGKKKGHRATFHRNPRFLSGLGMGGLMKAAVPAAIGGVGTVGVDWALMKLPLPDNIRAQIATGVPRALARAAVAFLGGWLAAKAFGKAVGEQITAGALTVIAYDAAKAAAGGALGLGYYDGDLAAYERVGYSALPALERIRVGNGGGMGMYVNTDELNGLMPVTR